MSTTNPASSNGIPPTLNRVIVEIMESLTSTVSQDENIRRRDHAENVLKRLQALQKDEQSCDVVLIAGTDGRRVAAHRLVLSASSDYFSAMFMGSMCEARENEVTLKEVYGDPLEALVQYCYTGHIELHEDTVQTLLVTARFLQLNDAFAVCCSFLAQQMKPSNCVEVAIFAEEQSLDTLLRLANAYMKLYFTEVYKNPDFLQLTADQFSELLASDDVNVPTEEDAFHSLMSWIEHDPSNREQHFPKLLTLVRMPFLKPSFLVDNVGPLCVSKECLQLLTKALMWHVLPERRSLITKPRNCNSSQLLSFGISCDASNEMSMESYCTITDEWTLWKIKHPKREESDVTVLGEKVVFVGGLVGELESLDLKTMTFARLNSMNTPRSYPGVAVLDGLLYAVGGCNNHSQGLNTVERWDPLTNQWRLVNSMSVGRKELGVAVLDGRLYAVGGYDNIYGSSLRSIERFNPHTNIWTTHAPMLVARGGVGVAVANGMLYALGGRSHNTYYNTMERYDPKTDTWTLMSSFSIARSNIGCALLGNKIMAVGGHDFRYSNVVEEFNLQTNKWTRKAPLKYRRKGACVVTTASNILCAL